MTTIQKIILLTLLSSSYFVLQATSSTSTNNLIKIEPIKEPKKVKKTTEDSPESILQELKSAIVTAKNNSKRSKEEEAQEILKELKAHTSQRITKPTTSTKKITHKKATHQKSLREQKRKRKIKKPKMKKRVKRVIIQKKATHQKNLKKKNKKQKIKKASKIRKKIINVTPKKKSPTKETVPLIKQENQTFQNLPEVKILGRVSETEAYEVQNIIPKRVELAQDAVVEFPTGSIETKELKSLKEVTPLEVIEVTPAFESIHAERYNLIKR